MARDTSPRFIAYQAVFHYLLRDQWMEPMVPLATEIACGTVRLLQRLEWIACTLAKRPKLKLKHKEKALLFTALYQLHFTDQESFAVVYETVEIAKKETHKGFVSFLNALLRNQDPLPHPPSWDIEYSYPPYYIDLLLSHYSKDTVQTILKAGNTPPVLMARHREDHTMVTDIPLQALTQSDRHYIQNSTQVNLLNELAQRTSHPETILDLCSAPGGKLLFAHDIYPKAKLTANDVSKKRLKQLQENCQRYNIPASLTNLPGEHYPVDQKYDLIILDVPCSNTGVLNKRPEARWRLSESTLNAHITLQQALLNHALSLLSPNGYIWYLTCSILLEENQSSRTPFLYEQTILPDELGADGGFGGLIKKSH
ncbi:MAG: methyltransferase domain-containing protein [Chlamydiia bacterium]|nr:methyltransferase domain-containing protein [Chlamydiia bacterium]